MSQSTNLEDKQQFLKWFLKTYQLKRRESLWILEYLLSHELILDKTSFVQWVDKTPRGMMITVAGMSAPAFRLYKEGHAVQDPEKAFHEMRMNWTEKLYIELNFPDAFLTPLYVKVLEDNPYARWNDRIAVETAASAKHAVLMLQLAHRRQELLEQIDASLERKNKEDFHLLTEELAAIERKQEILK